MNVGGEKRTESGKKEDAYIVESKIVNKVGSVLYWQCTDWWNENVLDQDP